MAQRFSRRGSASLSVGRLSRSSARPSSHDHHYVPEVKRNTTLSKALAAEKKRGAKQGSGKSWGQGRALAGTATAAAAPNPVSQANASQRPELAPNHHLPVQTHAEQATPGGSSLVSSPPTGTGITTGQSGTRKPLQPPQGAQLQPQAQAQAQPQPQSPPPQPQPQPQQSKSEAPPRSRISWVDTRQQVDELGVEPVRQGGVARRERRGVEAPPGGSIFGGPPPNHQSSPAVTQTAPAPTPTHTATPSAPRRAPSDAAGGTAGRGPASEAEARAPELAVAGLQSLGPALRTETAAPLAAGQQGAPPTSAAAQAGGERLDPRRWGVVDCRAVKEEDPQKARFDLELLELLNSRAAERASPSTPTSRPTTPRPMGAAFTDRSLRKREGLGSRGAFLAHAEPKDEAHRNCSCPVCKPFNLSPAGQASYSLPAALLQPRDREDTESHQHQPEELPRDRTSKGSRANPSYNSGSIRRIFDHGASAETGEEGFFQRLLGRKAKPAPFAGRSLSAGPSDRDRAGARAGCYRKKFGVDLEEPPETRQRILGSFGDHLSFGRGEVAMILRPCSADPPVPMRITSCKKADGEHKYQLSKHSERLSLHWNQPLYRYEVAACDEGASTLLRRSTSLPPERFQRRRWEEPEVSDAPVRRRSRLQESSAMAEVTNHEVLAEQAASERSVRLRTERRFADLCALTVETRANEVPHLQDIKERNYHKVSQNMANILCWND